MNENTSISDVKINNIEKSIGGIEKEMKILSTSMTKIAVQKERLDNLTTRVNAAWNKIDNQVLPALQQCPRQQIKWLWVTMIPLGLTQLIMGISMIRLFWK